MDGAIKMFFPANNFIMRWLMMRNILSIFAWHAGEGRKIFQGMSMNNLLQSNIPCIMRHALKRVGKLVFRSPYQLNFPMSTSDKKT